LIPLRVCDLCGEENSDDALICVDCGEKLEDKKNKPVGISKFYSNKVLLVVFLIVIIFVGLYSSNYFEGDTAIDVENPEILIESVTINDIERDWLENNTWQVSSTASFKILNSNSFEINVTAIEFSVYLIDNGVPVRIYDGVFDVGVVPSENFLSISESFWFLSEDEGVDHLKMDNLHFNVNGVVLFEVETSSSSQYGNVQFEGEV
jgi:hypothetical protein|tara:strand:- start:684 stop:1301 length:618 start_codon:yes stop_codon:yes gene_type:complete